MNLLMEKQLHLIAFIQHIQYPHFVAINKLFSSLQSIIAVIILASIFWAKDRKIGGRIIILYMLAAIITWLLKDTIQLPRPFILDPSLKLANAGGFSFPSGDAFAATVVYGALTCYYRKTILSIAAVIIILLVAYSRLALGVHYPTDVMGGILMGIIMLAVYFSCIEKKLDTLNINKFIYVPFMIIFPFIFGLVFTNIIPIVITGILSGFSLSLVLTNQKTSQPLSSILTVLMVPLGIFILSTLYYWIFFKSSTGDVTHKNLLILGGFLLGCWVALYPYFFATCFMRFNKKSSCSS